MKFLKFLFKSVSPKPPIEIGSKWIGSWNEGNPFCDDYLKVEDVKNGFVKFRRHYSFGVASAESDKESHFRMCFVRLPE